MSEKPLWQWSATEIASATQAGQISASDATEAAIARMEATNPDLNAVVESLADEARAQAASLDSSGKPKGPLHGVPVTIKVNVDQTGHATTNGVPAFKDMIAPDNAPLVNNLKAAGAVVIGRTNTPEFSFRADTDNPLHGHCLCQHTAFSLLTGIPGRYASQARLHGYRTVCRGGKPKRPADIVSVGQRPHSRHDRRSCAA